MSEEFSLRPVNVASALFFESAPELFRRVHREIRPRTPVPPIEVEYKRFANANSDVRLADGAIRVRISDVLENAPAPVTEALAQILLGKLYRRPVAKQYLHRYRLYLNRKDIRRQISLVRQTRGRKAHEGPEGSVHNLERIFENLNGRYFGGMMARPALGWSRFRSRTHLGHFDPSHNMIVISRIFDDPRAPRLAPRLALEYVMYHEMLHLRYPVDHNGARRRVHTREFREAEREFERLKEAREMLKHLSV